MKIKYLTVYSVMLVLIFGNIFTKHQMYELRGDDFTFSCLGVKDWDLFKIFSYSYLYESGRFLGNLLGFLSLKYLSLTQWKVIDSLIYVFIAILIYKFALKANNDDTYQHKIFIAISVFSLIVLFPYKINNNVAGYIMTASNYTYPTFALLFLAITFYKWCYSHFSKLEICLAILACGYCSNQELLAVILIIATACLLIFSTIKDDKKACICFALCFLISFIVFVITLLCPAHLVRTIGEYSLSTNIDPFIFADFSVLEKLYRGYTSTIAVYLFQVREPMLFICALLCALTSIANKNKLYNIVIASFPFALLIASHTMYYFGCDYLAFPYEHFKGFGGLANLVAYKINPIAHTSIVVSATIAIFCFVYSIILNFWKDKKHLILILLVVLVGVVSRELQSFTVLLYRIGERGLYLPLFCIILTNALLLTKLNVNTIKEKVGVLTLIYAVYFITTSKSIYYFE